MDWVTAYKIPLGEGVEALVDFLTNHADWLFDFVSPIWARSSMG